MSGVKNRLLAYELKHDIVLETRDADGKESEEVLHEAGDTIHFRRPKAKDMRVFDGADGGEISAIITLIKKLTKLDDLAVENLDSEDFEELGNVVVPSKKSGPPTGDAP